MVLAFRLLRPFLLAFVFGASVLVVELTGSRLVAPFIGSSIVVWAALLASILGGLSLGAWLGGYASISGYSSRWFDLCSILSAIFVSVIPIAASPIFSFINKAEGGITPKIIIIGVSILFIPPTIFLGSLYPFLLSDVVMISPPSSLRSEA
jgi:hypothetical protein